ncbi:MAG: hypothetical protein EOM85_00225 [Candidatus Moranbacteria bacterium]|nr:hypothetical protein [Candidatus Moranbacteria bacterium]
MYIATVIPIKKGIQGEYLSYFSQDNIDPGTMVVVPIKSREEDAIVVNSEEVLSLKSDIKNRDYQLKKILRIKGLSPFNKSFFDACQITKKYFVSNTGVIIKSMLPSVFIENLDKLKIKKEGGSDESFSINEKFVFQGNEQDRLAFYRTLIREAFAKKESIFICVPTKYDIDFFSKELSKGIEAFTLLFHSDLPQKKIIENYNQAIDKDHPLLIIGTGIFLSIPRNDIKTIVIEKESSDAYKQLSRPYIDIRTFAEILSYTKKVKLILGDTLLRPETLYRYDKGEFSEISSPTYRLSKTENIKIVDMKNDLDKQFKVLSKDVIELIDRTLEIKKSIFLFTLRKGLAPMTICNDCKSILLCPSCSTPVVLYGPKQDKESKDDRNRIFMCNKCGRKEKTETVCPNCNSWNLVPLGVGTDRVREELSSLYKDVKIFQIDKENVKTQKEAKEIIKNFYKTERSILIGTEMVFSYLDQEIYSSVVVSFDGLFSVPSFNISQKIIHLVDKLKNITEEKVIIQTRNPDNKILQSILSGNILPYLREDLVERQRFGYPPFKRLIKITFEGTSKETELTRKFLEESLSQYEPQVFSAFVGRIKGSYITNTVLKVDVESWPIIEKTNKKIDSELLNILYSLPPSFSINVDPEDLL